MSIYEKLAECQAVLGPVVGRDTEGQVGQRKYKYAGLQGVLEKVVPVLRDRGLVLVETIVNDSLTVSIVDYDPDDDRADLEMIKSVYPLPQTKDAQAFGSAITYGRRYSIVTMLGLVAGDDDDGAAATVAAKAAPAKKRKAPKGDERDKLLELIAKRLTKATGIEMRTSLDYAEATLTQWGVLRDEDTRPLTGEVGNRAWKDIAAAIDEGKWDMPDFEPFLAARAPF